ncbi:hypothetical protein [Mesorhizobium australicum]|uniref:Uncharacterized protein n=1 Tax=Mesorhizobium australicum TaxID=536018 RepID=A0A1X7Q0E0_9HYPH|nr:hypothetical protein [Mesorhizobium australicum]SMH58059.1 hypothetical protein SAMN02982922_5923 [Mesorhizobium australicum]
MKTLLAAAALLGLTASGALAAAAMTWSDRNHQSVATLDMSTTASTTPETPVKEEKTPAEAK